MGEVRTLTIGVDAAPDDHRRTLAPRAKRGSVLELQTVLLEAVRLGADYVLIGSDQAREEDLPSLLEPLTSGAADFVEGERQAGPLEKWARKAPGLLHERAGSLAARLPLADHGLGGVRALNRRALLRLGATSLLHPSRRVCETAEEAGLATLSVPLTPHPEQAGIGGVLREGWSYVYGAVKDSLANAQQYGASRALTVVAAFCFSSGTGLGAAAALGAVSSVMPGIVLAAAAVLLLGAAAIIGSWRAARDALRDTVAGLQGRGLSESQAF